MNHKSGSGALALGLVAFCTHLQAQSDRAHDLAAKASGQVTASCDSVATADDCHPGKATGCSHAAHPRYDPYLNFLKNQTPGRDLAPARALEEADFVSIEDKIPAEMSQPHHDHSQFADRLAAISDGIGEGNIYAVVGYLYFVENTAITSHHRGETCNCQLRTNNSFDFHLGIGFDPDLAAEIRTSPPAHDSQSPGPAEQTSIVAEMTPHTRDVNWTVARLNRQQGKQVKVVGQLMLDNAHLNPKDDCAFSEEPEGGCWRASVWEIHPVTQFLPANPVRNALQSRPTQTGFPSRMCHSLVSLRCISSAPRAKRGLSPSRPSAWDFTRSNARSVIRFSFLSRKSESGSDSARRI